MKGTASTHHPTSHSRAGSSSIGTPHARPRVPGDQVSVEAVMMSQLDVIDGKYRENLVDEERGDEVFDGSLNQVDDQAP